MNFVPVLKSDYELQYNIYNGTMILTSQNEELKIVHSIKHGYIEKQLGPRFHF